MTHQHPLVQKGNKNGNTSVMLLLYLAGIKISGVGGFSETLAFITRSVINAISTDLGKSKLHITIGCLLFVIFCDVKLYSNLPGG